MEEVKQALRQAYTGEAKAALRLKVFAEKAREEGYPQVAKLFEVISFSEGLHGRRALRLLKEIKGTQENLSESFESETKVAGVAYDGFIRLAEKAGDEGCIPVFQPVEGCRGYPWEAVQGGHGPSPARARDNLLRMRGLRLCR